MRKRLEIGLVMFLVVAITGFLVFSSPLPSPAPGGPPSVFQAVENAPAVETTIRNVTDQSITYKIYPVRRPWDVEIKQIAPNAIDRYRMDEKLVIEFNTGEKDNMHYLDPGTPYSFRFNKRGAIDLFLGAHGRADAVDLAPYVATPPVVVDKMLELVRVTGQDTLYDIGCGDGRIVITAARKYGARGVGIDIDKGMVEISQTNAMAAGVAQLVKFICMDATKADISAATVVTLYLLTESNALLRPILERQLRPGTRVVSHNYMIAGWEQKQAQTVSVKDENGINHYIYAYVR